MELFKILAVLGHIGRAPHVTVTWYSKLGAERFDVPYCTRPDIVVVATQCLERKSIQADEVDDGKRRSLRESARPTCWREWAGPG